MKSLNLIALILFLSSLTLTQCNQREITFIFETFHSPSSSSLRHFQTHFNIGQQLRLNYIHKYNHLKPKYNIDEIDIISSNTKPNLHMAYAELLGLFSSETVNNIDQTEINSSLPLLDYHSSDSDYTSANVINIDTNFGFFAISTYSKQNQTIFELSQICTGWKESKSNQFDIAYNSFISNYGNELPSRSISSVLEYCEAMIPRSNNNSSSIDDKVKACNEIDYWYTYTVKIPNDETALYLSSSTFQFILNKFQGLINGASSAAAAAASSSAPWNTAKYLMNSGNKYDLAALLRSIWMIFDYKLLWLPNWNSSLLIELSAWNSEFYVSVYYGKECLVKEMSFNEFQRKIRYYTLHDNKVNAFCGINAVGISTSNMIYIFGICLLTFCLCSVSFVLYKQVNEIWAKRKEYVSFNTDSKEEEWNEGVQDEDNNNNNMVNSNI